MTTQRQIGRSDMLFSCSVGYRVTASKPLFGQFSSGNPLSCMKMGLSANFGGSLAFSEASEIPS